MKINPGKEIYYEEYIELIERAETLDYQEREVCFENHHIIPRSLGGSNDKSNMVRLAALDHFKCHYLLVKFLEEGSKEQYKMVCAMNLMLRIGPTAEDYQTIKDENLKLLSSYNSNLVMARVVETNEVVRISKEVFRSNPDIYTGVTKGMTPVIDKEGNSFNVSVDDPRLNDGTLQHHLKGRNSLYHPILKKRTSVLDIDLEDYLNQGWSTEFPTPFNWYHHAYLGLEQVVILSEVEIEIWEFLGWEPGRGKKTNLYHEDLDKYTQVPIGKTQEYLDNGWVKKSRPKEKGARMWIWKKNNNEKTKILKKDLDKYLDQGWSIGRGPNKPRQNTKEKE